MQQSLKISTSLEKNYVQGFQRDSNMDSDGAQQNSNSNNNNIADHNHIQRLSLSSYHPSTDDELLYIMENYTELDYLKMEGKSGISWPTTTIGSSVMLPFMKFFQNCKRYDITFGGVSDETWLMNLFYDRQMDIGQSNYKIHFTINAWKWKEAP